MYLRFQAKLSHMFHDVHSGPKENTTMHITETLKKESIISASKILFLYQRRVPILSVVLIMTFLFSVMTVPRICAQVFPPTYFENRQAEKFARTLLEEHRYIEAISYLRNELHTVPDGAADFTLLLLLADAQIAIGDLNGALATLNEAENLAVRQSDKKALAQRKMRLDSWISGSKDKSSCKVSTEHTDIPGAALYCYHFTLVTGQYKVCNMESLSALQLFGTEGGLTSSPLTLIQ